MFIAIKLLSEVVIITSVSVFKFVLVGGQDFSWVKIDEGTPYRVLIEPRAPLPPFSNHSQRFGQFLCQLNFSE